MKSYRLVCVSQALSPISHASGTAGNESIIARQDIKTPRGMVKVPFLSGNALRHRSVRAPGMLHLIDRWQLAGKLSKLILNFLLHGGNLTESTAHENTERIAAMHRLFPLLRLLGGSLPNQILAGSLDCWAGALVCEETREMLTGLLPCFPQVRLLPAERFSTGWQYTRSDAGRRNLHAASPDDAETASNLMIFSGQAVAAGSMFVHGYVLKHVTEIEYGALLHSLALWQADGGTIGGKAGIGHGRLRLHLLEPGDIDGPIARYLDYIDHVRDDAVAWLQAAFDRPSTKKPAKGKKAKGGDEGPNDPILDMTRQTNSELAS